AGDLASNSLRSEEPATGEAAPARDTEEPVGLTVVVSPRGATLVPRAAPPRPPVGAAGAVSGAAAGGCVGGIWGVSAWACLTAGSFFSATGTAGVPAPAEPQSQTTPRPPAKNRRQRTAVERRMSSALLGEKTSRPRVRFS